MEFGVYSPTSGELSKATPNEILFTPTIWTNDLELKALSNELPCCFLGKDGVLRRRDSSGNTQIIIPRNLIPRVLGMMHDDLGHFGYAKTLQGTKERYFWPYMSSQIEDWCRKCAVCQR